MRIAYCALLLLIGNLGEAESVLREATGALRDCSSSDADLGTGVA